MHQMSYTWQTPEQDRAVIRKALDAVEAWDEWDGDICNSDRLEHSLESLRKALTSSGYLPIAPQKVGSNG
jgi:hypothetical protein